MPEFPHLKLPIKVQGSLSKPSRGFSTTQSRTLENKTNRQAHAHGLQQKLQSLAGKWRGVIEAKKEQGVEVRNPDHIPLFLQIDKDAMPIDSLVNWGIDIVSEEPDGYIIGASIDNLTAFQENVNQFLNGQGRYKDTAAKIWDINDDISWRTDLIKGELKSIWDNINLGQNYFVEVGVSCQVPNKKKYPAINDFDSEENYNKKVDEFHEHEREIQIARGEKQLEREADIEYYVNSYGGTVIAIWDNEIDVVYFKIEINGAGLRDIVFNYQHLFEVKLDSPYSVAKNAVAIEDDYQPDLIPPIDTHSVVCVIDSGIQEGHRLILPAIIEADSRSYVNGDDSVSDFVKSSGHGTHVAGVVLYPNGVPKTGPYQLETKIQNARILDRDCRISDREFGPVLMEKIVSDFSNTKIFNLSVCDLSAYSGTHMPALAASIDKLMHEKDVLFVIASGNLYLDSSEEDNLGIAQHFEKGRKYPTYLDENSSKIASPSVSFFAITVGSISHSDFEDENYIHISGKDYISSYSRSGLGMWGCIKPDVVEYGGDYIVNKQSPEIINHEATSIELVNSTMHNASAVGRDSCGTSYSAPKVTYILSRLLAEHPTQSALMLKALLVQSARLPSHCFDSPSHNDFRYYGYGIPNLDRALNNHTGRVTFIQNGSIGAKKADIYRLNIPPEIRGEGKNFKILVEVTLTFTARTRLTRKGAHSYLSTWLEWQSSKYNEGFNSFRSRTLQYLEQEEGGENFEDQGTDSIRWCLRENPKYSSNEINRNNSATQKSWVLLDPHQFADEFCIAVVGHAGWDKNLESSVSYALCVSFEAFGEAIEIYAPLSQAQIEIEQEIEF
jgi:subtilisin family serine protease